jgi:transcription initiation factor TFIIIB Brf1 subunit/transcription initiation factor TFIIB
MKRLGLTVTVAFFLVTSTFAAGNKSEDAKWNGEINVNKLSNYLALSASQSEEVGQICDYFSEQMRRASYSRKNYDALLHNAVYGNLKLMKGTLTPEQYTKYLQVINVTLRNRNIEVK